MKPVQLNTEVSVNIIVAIVELFFQFFENAKNSFVREFNKKESNFIFISSFARNESIMCLTEFKVSYSLRVHI